jgi:hypothetical protein
VLTAVGVDDLGVVRHAPQPLVLLTLVTPPTWGFGPANPQYTDAGGVVRWFVRCSSPGPHPVVVELPTHERLPLDVPPCAAPPPPPPPPPPPAPA